MWQIIGMIIGCGVLLWFAVIIACSLIGSKADKMMQKILGRKSENN